MRQRVVYVAGRGVAVTLTAFEERRASVEAGRRGISIEALIANAIQLSLPEKGTITSEMFATAVRQALDSAPFKDTAK